jgi:hypothetical protein
MSTHTDAPQEVATPERLDQKLKNDVQRRQDAEPPLHLQTERRMKRPTLIGPYPGNIDQLLVESAAATDRYFRKCYLDLTNDLCTSTSDASCNSESKTTDQNRTPPDSNSVEGAF